MSHSLADGTHLQGRQGGAGGTAHAGTGAGSEQAADGGRSRQACHAGKRSSQQGQLVQACICANPVLPTTCSVSASKSQSADLLR